MPGFAASAIQPRMLPFTAMLIFSKIRDSSPAAANPVLEKNP
jgi:hypothetical protein